MGYDIETMEDCASNYGVFEVPSSSGDGKYTVTFCGSEGQPHCTCKAFEFALANAKECKHIREVWDKACMYNPQWHDATEEPELRPVSYTYEAFTKGKCTCGGPLVAVRRAV